MTLDALLNHPCFTREYKAIKKENLTVYQKSLILWNLDIMSPRYSA